MKTKNKIIAMVEIAIVLCSVLLMAIPTIAADQTAQEVSASEVTSASEDDYVLDIYGNANEDDTIDMGDVVYTKLAIFGKKPKTELCDAKYDGRINVLDVIQTKLIILGKEKELTVVDVRGEAVTVKKPVERIVVTMIPEAEVLRSINAADKIVGVCTFIRDNPIWFPELSRLPLTGTFSRQDYEAILNLNTDVVLAHPRWVDEEKLPGVTVIGLSLTHPKGFTERVRLLGYILDKEEEAEEYINWHDGYIEKIKSRTEGLSEDEKPRVLLQSLSQVGAAYNCFPGGTRMHEICDMAGGINIGADLKCGHICNVDPEWLIVQNPDRIVLWSRFICNYAMDDPSEMAALRDDFLNRPELANVNAVKTSSIYVLANRELATGGSGCLLGLAYLAKWFYPDLFEDLDPQAIHQEYLDRFQRIDFNVYEHGVFVYPPLES